MGQIIADEYGFDPGLEDTLLPPEFGGYGDVTDYGDPAPEDVVPLEIPAASSEYEPGLP